MNHVTSDQGLNRTGMGLPKGLGREMIDGASGAKPSARGDEHAFAAVRESYALEARLLGAAPPRGILRAAIDAVRVPRPGVLVDKLAERLAFERAGSRLWEALLSKYDAYGTWTGGPQRSDLEAILSDEMRHFELLHRTITKLGADPTQMSPSADLAGVECKGLVQVLTDPRADLAQSLHAMLLAELADHEGWAMLVDLAAPDHLQLSASFVRARNAEARHLTLVRQWLREHGRLATRGELAAPSPSHHRA